MALLALAAGACRVYNPDLVRTDAAADLAPVDVPPDRSVDTGLDAPDAAIDARDVPDVLIDAGPSCDPLLAMRRPCIEPYSGHAWNVEDPRLIAPLAVAVAPSTPTRVLVTDPGSARVMSYAEDGSMARRIAGTGVVGAPLTDGPARETTVHTPTAMVYLPNGDLVIADAAAHALYVLRSATGRLERLGRSITFVEGPSALALLDMNTLLVAADNRVYTVSIAGGDAAAPMPIVGQACGTSCRGFNTTPTAGLMTQLNGPTGVDFDATFVYIADSANCRIRRAARNNPTTPFRTEVFAGSGCDRNSDILAASTGGGTVAATSARLGPVGDVRVAPNGWVFFTDPEAHCAILGVSPTGQLRVVAGHSSRCGERGVGGLALGRLGNLTLSPDGSTLYFVDQQNHRIGRIPVNLPTGAGTPIFTIEPGATPGASELPESVRVGSVSGVAATGTALPHTVFWAGAAEGRVYRATTGPVTVLTGTGRDRLITAIPAAQFEPAFFAGLGVGDGRLVLGIRSHHSIGLITGPTFTSLFRIAGTYDTPGNPMLTGPASGDTVTAPGWPLAAGGNLYFVTDPPGARVYRVDGASATSPLVAVAGSAPGVDGGAPAGDGGGAPATSVALGRPQGLALDRNGNLYVADSDNGVVWRVRAGGTIEVAAGIYRQRAPFADVESDARDVAIYSPTALAYDGADTLYIADTEYLRIRALNIATNRIVTVAGSGPPAPNGATASGDYGDPLRATLARPTALAWNDGLLYIGEGNTGRVRVLRVPR
jgi:sugar lactone lactonase YvrE